MARWLGLKDQPQIDPSSLVFIDETWTTSQVRTFLSIHALSALRRMDFSRLLTRLFVPAR